MIPRSPAALRCISGLLLAGVAFLTLACGGPGAPAAASAEPTDPAQDLLVRAAAEATAIVREAQATAIVLHAQAQATAMIAAAEADEPVDADTSGAPGEPGPPGETLAAADPALPSGPELGPQWEGEGSETEEVAAAEPLTTTLLDVSFAADGGMIMVRFIAPPAEAERWWQGNVSVEDEAGGARYTEIPVMPIVGPLIGRPKMDGQIGYVMLVNAPSALQPGATVTVVLGQHRFEHVSVR